MATVITISVANDTVGQTVQNVLTLDDDDRLVQAFLAILTKQVEMVNSRKGADEQLSPFPNVITAMNQIVNLASSVILNAANRHYVGEAQRLAEQQVVEITAVVQTKVSKIVPEGKS